jgi:transcriptional regulator with XRE-family HTH domain
MYLWHTARMEVTAREITDWALAEITKLSKSGQWPTEAALNKELAAISGVSESLIMKFRSGERPSPQVRTLDKLVTAIKAVKRLRAA